MKIKEDQVYEYFGNRFIVHTAGKNMVLVFTQSGQWRAFSPIEFACFTMID